ncbi:gamma-glutamylcyclotransferase [Ruminococcaceae bacterium OttesenSCG-928-D13]|nr:gamma-glutamylcyclotransferase [Ruminococcaceae bacterium OttesenSCG-928-D13]
MNDKNTIYLAYGSNLNLEQMSWRCPYARVLGPVEVRDYRLLFRGGNGGSVATIEPSEGDSVPALLWEITPRDEEALDRYEGWPRLYRKEEIMVTFGGEDVSVMVYIMNEGPPLGLPSRGYLGTILEGYESAGFSTLVLDTAVKASQPPRGAKWAQGGHKPRQIARW